MIANKFSFNYNAVVWAPYGDLWRDLRFLRVIEIFFSEEIGMLIRGLFEVSNKNGITGARINLSSLLLTFTFNVMMRIGTGKSCISEQDLGTEKGKQIIEEIREVLLATLVVLNVCDFFPVLKWFGYKGIEKGYMVSVHKKRNKFLNSLIDEFRQIKVTPISVLESSTDRNTVKKSILVETLLSLKEPEPKFYTDDLIKSVILMLLAAGAETTSMNIQSTPHKLRAEIESKVGNERLLNKSDLINLPYLQCAIHRDPELSDQPKKFKPERFEATEGEKERFSHKFMPFGLGGRACPGASIGLRSVSLVLGSLIQLFDWKSVEFEENLDACYNSRFSSNKEEPLEAICIPRQNCI
ncbi:unnamed protein product [Withania somnifera]